jgi:hypothetical protein
MPVSNARHPVPKVSVLPALTSSTEVAVVDGAAPLSIQKATTGQRPAQAPVVLVARPLPRVLLLHCGGTMGMDPKESFEQVCLGLSNQVYWWACCTLLAALPLCRGACLVQDPAGHIVLKPGTGGKYHTPGALKPGSMLGNLLNIVPELKSFACLDLKVAFNLGAWGGGVSGCANMPCLLTSCHAHLPTQLGTLCCRQQQCDTQALAAGVPACLVLVSVTGRVWFIQASILPCSWRRCLTPTATIMTHSCWRTALTP